MTLDLVSDTSVYLPTLERRLAQLEGAPCDLVPYNAGVDPHEGCDVGGLRDMTRGILAAREAAVFAWARSRGLRIAFVTAGGYKGSALTQDELVALHRLTIRAAAQVASQWKRADGPVGLIPS